MVDLIIERGDVYRVSFRGSGRELVGPHYAIVVSDEPYNWLSTVVVVPLSSGARPASFRVEVSFLGAQTRALVDQISAVDKSRLREFMGSVVGTPSMALIDEQLRALLALEEY